MHKSIFMNGLYSSFGQHNIIPAQYLRDEARIDEYLANNLFLKDINVRYVFQPIHQYTD